MNILIIGKMVCCTAFIAYFTSCLGPLDYLSFGSIKTDGKQLSSPCLPAFVKLLMVYFCGELMLLVHVILYDTVRLLPLDLYDVIEDKNF